MHYNDVIICPNKIVLAVILGVVCIYFPCLFIPAVTGFVLVISLRAVQIIAENLTLLLFGSFRFPLLSYKRNKSHTKPITCFTVFIIIIWVIPE